MTIEKCTRAEDNGLAMHEWRIMAETAIRWYFARAQSTSSYKLFYTRIFDKTWIDAVRNLKNL